MFLRCAACLSVLATGWCGFYIGTAPTSAPNVVIVLSAGTWELCADRAWTVAPGTSAYPARPTDPLRESDYRPINAPVTYSIVVAAQGASVSIDGSPAIRGTRSEQSDRQVTYTLSEGLFAGGRLVVWKDGSGYQGELTIYGSGVPVARSERGRVVRAR